MIWRVRSGERVRLGIGYTVRACVVLGSVALCGCGGMRLNEPIPNGESEKREVCAAYLKTISVWRGDGTAWAGVVASPLRDGAGMSHAGAVELIGPKGIVLWARAGESEGAMFGLSVCAVGDVDGDGWEEVGAGAAAGSRGDEPPAGIVYLLSGRTGEVLWRVEGEEPAEGLGNCVARISDIDGDSKDELIASAPDSGIYREGLCGRVVVLSGASGAVLVEIRGEPRVARVGDSICSCDDTDGDGREDIVVGFPDEEVQGNREVGRVRVYSSATGIETLGVGGVGVGGRFGSVVGRGGDVDGDGVRDLVVGAPGANEGRGAVRVLSGRDCRVLRKIDGEPDIRALGCGPLCVLPDRNGDGVGEIGILFSKHGWVRVRVYCGRSMAAMGDYEFKTSDCEAARGIGDVPN